MLIYFGEKITIQAHERVRTLLHLLEAEPIAGIRNLHPAYCSLLVKFDPLKWQHEKLEKELRKYLGRLDKVKLPETRHVEIPVCYGGEFGPDLESVAAAHGIMPQRVIELHSSPTYLVYFLGFTPGFAYLGELPQELVTPRLPSPRFGRNRDFVRRPGLLRLAWPAPHRSDPLAARTKGTGALCS